MHSTSFSPPRRTSLPPSFKQSWGGAKTGEGEPTHFPTGKTNWRKEECREGNEEEKAVQKKSFQSLCKHQWRVVYHSISRLCIHSSYYRLCSICRKILYISSFLMLRRGGGEGDECQIHVKYGAFFLARNVCSSAAIASTTISSKRPSPHSRELSGNVGRSIPQFFSVVFFFLNLYFF